MGKIRTLTLEGMEYRVDAYGCMIGEYKFGGLPLHAIRDYQWHDECFGDQETWGSFYWKVPKGGGFPSNPESYRYYQETDQGFVYEISAEDYIAAERAYIQQGQEDEERENAIREASDTLAELEEEEKGRCAACEVLMIQGVRCHEQGCPRYARLKEARSHLERLEDY